MSTDPYSKEIGEQPPVPLYTPPPRPESNGGHITFNDEQITPSYPSAAFVGQTTPPGSPGQRLLPLRGPPEITVLTPRDSEKTDREPGVAELMRGDSVMNALGSWTPLPLRPWFWISFLSFIALGAIILEILLAVSNRRQGWAAGSSISSQQGVLHYLYTLPPVIVAMFFVAMWTWTDIEIKKMQPYLDLVHGQSPAHRSLLLDYTRLNNFVVWTKAASNRHFLVALTSLMVLLTLSFQPLSAALLSVRDTWRPLPDMNVTSFATVGLNQGSEFLDLTVFLTAAGYASASALYQIGDPNFIHDVYTIGPFELPRQLVKNGTIVANTTAVKSEANCRPADAVHMVQTETGWDNTATAGPCTLAWSVDKTAVNLFGAAVPDCFADTPVQFRPVLFWFFTYEPRAAAAAAFCAPAVSLWAATAHVDLATGNLTDLTGVRSLDAGSPAAAAAANLTGAPLNGHAYNGIEFPLKTNDTFVLARRDAIQLQLPAAMFQAARDSADGLAAAFGAGGFAPMAQQVYTTYLKLVAKSVYFTPAEGTMRARVSTFKKRVWLSALAVHLLAGAMLLLAACGTLVHVQHARERRSLRLTHQPGTIASAVSFSAQTHVADLLGGSQREEEFVAALRDKKFRIDPGSMKIVLEGEEGYEAAASPDPRRSIFGFINGPSKPGGVRFSRLWSGRP